VGLTVRPVGRDEILDYATYEEHREALRHEVLVAKEARRVHVGRYFTVLFENRLTVRYQIQEMVRVERIVREADIQHEIATYNELLGGPGEVGCTLLIEIDDPAERAAKLGAWHGLPARFHLTLPDGRRAHACMDQRQEDDRRISAVHYLKFDTGGAIPVSLGLDYPGLEAEVPFDGRQRAALHEDLQDSMVPPT
jgi:hypothetical protein